MSQQDKTRRAIKTIEILHDPNKEYILAFSGGKDSIVIYDLAKKSKVSNIINYIHSNTTIDPPGHLKFIRNNYPDVKIIHPKYSFYKLIEKKGLPTRLTRFCCQYLKEYVGKNAKVIEGIRLEESITRRTRLSNIKEPEVCDTRIKGKIHVYPILNWTEKDIWDYIHLNNLTYPIEHYRYNKRMGCVGCPLTTQNNRIKDYQLYPKYVKAILQAIRKNIENEGPLSKRFNDEYDAFNWWISGDSIHIHELKRDSGFFKIDYKKELQILLRTDII